MTEAKSLSKCLIGLLTNPFRTQRTFKSDLFLKGRIPLLEKEGISGLCEWS